jgi:peptidoglycan-N-acetylmuramic acid deacetylase
MLKTFFAATLLCIFTMFGRNDYIMTSLSNMQIDNTNHGWGVTRNSTHKQPDIPESTKRILSKYNGIYVGEPDIKSVYLTIDLGYESGNTENVLDVLKKDDVKATFFIVSSYLQDNPQIVDRIVYEGHSLQNHTTNYKHLYCLNEHQIKMEIMVLHKLVEKRYGISMKYLRLPYEEWSEKVMKASSETGYKTVFWSAACVDWVEGKAAQYIYNSVINNYHNGAVILIHAVSKDSPTAVDTIIKSLKSKGYKFNTLDM